MKGLNGLTGSESFRELEGDEKAAVILIRCLAGQGRLEEALAMIEGFHGKGQDGFDVCCSS